MVIDTSAMLAILRDEPERSDLLGKLLADGRRQMAAPTFLETAIVMEARYGYEGGRDLDHFMHTAAIQLVPFTAEHAEFARRAYLTYGRGHHLAGLNFGDCISYALAKAAGEPLLFKGEDFAKTDVRAS